MSRAVKLGLLALVITSMVWLTTLWRWQSAGTDVGQQDIVMQLLVLPLALMLTLWLAIRMGGQVRRQLQAQPSVPVAPSAALDQAALRAPGAAPVLPWDVVLLGSEVCLMPGEHAVTVAQQVRERKVWPRLDERLSDFNGLPVFAARVPELSGGVAQGSDLSTDWPEHRQRAALLMARVWQPMAERILETRWQAAWQQGDPAKPGDQGHPLNDEAAEQAATPAHLAGVGRERRRQTEASRLRMTVAVVLPEDAPQAFHTACLTQAQRIWEDLLEGEPVPLPWQMAWEVWAVASPQALWARMDQAMRDGSSPHVASPTSVVALVADSALDEACIEQWQGRGELFTAEHQQGRVPGEGAVALWWSHPNWPAAGTSDLPAVRMMPAMMGPRDRSADVPGRVGSEALQACITQAMAVAGPKVAKADWQVFSDADHRASRTGELFEALTEVAPHLDPMQAVHRVGDVCGDLGLCAGLAPLALAEGVMRERLWLDDIDPDAPPAALVVSVLSPIHRMAVALVPVHVKQP